MKEKLKKVDINTGMFNAVKALIALAFTNLFGWIVNFLVFRGANEIEIEGASFRTAVLSFLIFIFHLAVLYKFIKIESKSEKTINEASSCKVAYKESGYSFDFKVYFKTFLKKRGWGYYIPSQIWQIPLLINYIIVAANPEDITIYELPIYIYKWCMNCLFAYEAFPSFFFLGFFIYNLLFIPSFTYLLYRFYKSLLVKPSYLK